MSVSKERRQSRRVDTRIELSVSGLDSASSGASAMNLSVGGAYLEVERPLAPLSKLEVGLELPRFGSDDEDTTPHRIRVEAIVVRSEPAPDSSSRFYVGIAFLNMKPADRQRLEDYIDWRLTRSILESVDSGGAEGQA